MQKQYSLTDKISQFTFLSKDLITTPKYKNHNLTMQVHGTNVDNITVKITSEQLSTKPYSTTTKYDSNLEEGKTRVEVSGYDGATAQSYRHVYKDGKLVSSTKEAYSSYKKRDAVVYVGTKKVEQSTPSTNEGNSETTPSTSEQNILD